MWFVLTWTWWWWLQMRSDVLNSCYWTADGPPHAAAAAASWWSSVSSSLSPSMLHSPPLTSCLSFCVYINVTTCFENLKLSGSLTSYLGNVGKLPESHGKLLPTSHLGPCQCLVTPCMLESGYRSMCAFLNCVTGTSLFVLGLCFCVCVLLVAVSLVVQSSSWIHYSSPQWSVMCLMWHLTRTYIVWDTVITQTPLTLSLSSFRGRPLFPPIDSIWAMMIVWR